MGKRTSIDYYEILQVSPRADQEIIKRVFRILAKRYHPDNKHTGDVNKFEILTEAYVVLSDPEKRAAHDENFTVVGAHNKNMSFDAPQSRDPEAERRINRVILLTFYIARKRDVMKPGIGIIDLGRQVGLPEKELEFHVWYLREKDWIQRIETGEFAITAMGVDEVVGNNLRLRGDRLLSFADD